MQSLSTANTSWPGLFILAARPVRRSAVVHAFQPLIDSLLPIAGGTRVFGEYHPDLLERFDDVFQQGNGTTYALTRLTTHDGDISLQMDIRYALGHQSEPWDGITQGLLPGSSIFPDVFAILINLFNATFSDASLTFETVNLVGPDVRDPNSERFQRVREGYEDVIGEPSPLRAIGGGTDAKGYPNLIAAGALFSDDFGPPINFHGIGEGAPIDDLHLSGQILWHILLREIGQGSDGLSENPTRSQPGIVRQVDLQKVVVFDGR